jgi:hypothetical protein
VTHEQRAVWIYLAISIVAYAIYLILVIPQVLSRPVAEVDYIPVILWTIGGSIVGAIVVNIIAGIFSRNAEQGDRRDKEIDRFGEYQARGLVFIGAIVALVLAMLRVDQFWIANVIYLGFTLSAIAASGIKLKAYHEGFQPW